MPSSSATASSSDAPTVSELADEADEALDVGPAQLLVRAGEARELAEVRVAAPTVPLGEDGEVVVVLGEDPLAEPLERDPRGQSREPVVALAEGAEELRVAVGEASGQRPLEPDEERAPLGRAPEVEQSASFETPTNGDARTVTSASSS